MPCTSRLRLARTATGVVALKATSPYPPNTLERLQVPCGRCLSCRLDDARSKAIRSVHEARMHDRSCFVTLTYDDAHLPPNNSVSPAELKAFLKRLRERLRPVVGRIRFMAVGEYGEKLGRPHYHLILYGTDFHFDRVRRPGNRRFPLYTSPTLEAAWERKGHVSIGQANFSTAAYVARYVVSKVTGEMAAKHYGVRRPEFYRCSLKPGLGHDWLHRYLDEVYPADEVVIDGKTHPPPKYYDELLLRWDPDLFDLVMQGRQERDDREEWSRDRLAAHAKHVEAQFSVSNGR